MGAVAVSSVHSEGVGTRATATAAGAAGDRRIRTEQPCAVRQPDSRSADSGVVGEPISGSQRQLVARRGSPRRLQAHQPDQASQPGQASLPASQQACH